MFNMQKKANDAKHHLKVAISSCPNDTFSFYYFLHEPLESISFEVDYLDIEQLNQAALQKSYDLVKISFAMAPLVQEHYQLLQAGSALGFGVGPVLIAKDASLFWHKLEQKKPLRLALPGKHTTAHFLWQYFLHVHLKKNYSSPILIEPQFMIFSDILKAVQKGSVDAGVLIHEGRFVYRNLDLTLLQDLGEFWEQDSGHPIPLGGIFAKRNLSPQILQILEAHLSKSIAQAFFEKKQNSQAYKNNMIPYIKSLSQELEDSVLEKHISYYVNNETQQLSDKGNQAIDFFYRQHKRLLE